MTGESARFTAVIDPRPDDRPWERLTWPPAPDTCLVGDVVELAPAVLERDAEPLFRALDHDAVWRHLGTGRPRDPEALAAAVGRRFAPGTFFTFVVRLRAPVGGLATGTVVGTTSYLDAAPADARLEIGATVYAKAVWATKVNPEAKLLLLEHAFETLGAGRVQLKTDVRNVRSQQAIARLGARFEGVLRRHMRRADGTVRDTVLFSIVAEEWPDVRARLRARLAAG